MTPEELAAIKARAEAATPGPWEGATASTYVRGVYTLSEYFVRCPEDDVAIASEILEPATSQPSIDNAAFIAAARTDVPALVAEVERLQGQVAMLRDVMSDIEYVYRDLDSDDSCPFCGYEIGDGHNDGCAWAAAMRGTEPPQGETTVQHG